MSKRDSALLISDILLAISKSKQYTKGLDLDDFMANPMMVDAVERNFEIIGEAVNQIPRSLQEENPTISWHSVVSFRNQLIHGYFGVDYQILWYVIQNDLPDLENKFLAIKL